MRRIAHLASAVAMLLLAACSKQVGNPAPPKIETPADLPRQTSRIVVPMTARLAELEAGLNARSPRQLWSIDRREPKCVKGQRVKVLGVRAKVTPDLGCRIVGQVTRGSIRLGGSGSTLLITMPVSAAISARDIGGVVKRETATGSANVRATVKLSVNRNWDPVAKVDIAYDWVEPPGIDFLGQRIKFVEKADAKLKGVIAGLERDLPRELLRLHLRDHLQSVWKQGFATIELNRERPPAWMRVTPQRLGFGGYRVGNGRIEMMLAADAFTETFVGERPGDPVATPLPPPAARMGAPGLRFFIPVVADYAQLEPVILRALRKRAAKGIVLKGIGPVEAEFDQVTVYATEGGRLAVGIRAKAHAKGSSYSRTNGVIWLWAIPFNDPNSQRVRVRDLRIAGDTDNTAVNLLFSLFADELVLEDIRAGLTHDFNKDYERVLAAARKAIAGRREGDFILSASIADVRNGQLKVTGQGLFLPVEATGTATITYSPLRVAKGSR